MSTSQLIDSAELSLAAYAVLVQGDTAAQRTALLMG